MRPHVVTEVTSNSAAPSSTDQSPLIDHSSLLVRPHGRVTSYTIGITPWTLCSGSSSNSTLLGPGGLGKGARNVLLMVSTRIDSNQVVLSFDAINTA